jgi:hypothetical protein
MINVKFNWPPEPDDIPEEWYWDDGEEYLSAGWDQKIGKPPAGGNSEYVAISTRAINKERNWRYWSPAKSQWVEFDPSECATVGEACALAIALERLP